MNNIQKYWIYFLIAFSLFHLCRDIMQTLGIKNIISEMLVKKNKPDLLIFHPSNTYIIEFVELILSVIILRNNYFGMLGYLTIFIAISTAVGFLVYWFLF